MYTSLKQISNYTLSNIWGHFIGLSNTEKTKSILLKSGFE